MCSPLARTRCTPEPRSLSKNVRWLPRQLIWRRQYRSCDISIFGARAAVTHADIKRDAINGRDQSQPSPAGGPSANTSRKSSRPGTGSSSRQSAWPKRRARPENRAGACSKVAGGGASARGSRSLVDDLYDFRRHDAVERSGAMEHSTQAVHARGKRQ